MYVHSFIEAIFQIECICVHTRMYVFELPLQSKGTIYHFSPLLAKEKKFISPIRWTCHKRFSHKFIGTILSMPKKEVQYVHTYI